MLRTARWLQCDFPGCVTVYNPERYRVYVAAHPRSKHMRDGAASEGWLHTNEGDDLCKRHAAVHQQRPPQPALFPVSEDDHRV